MSRIQFIRRLALAAAVCIWMTDDAMASDVPAIPTPIAAGPVQMPVGAAPGCATCQHGLLKSSCKTCGRFTAWQVHKDKKGQFQVTLCPGSCFGYFQPQWRKWDDVCPYPHQGMGPGEVPQPPTMTPPTPPGTGLGDPRPLDPKMPMPKPMGSDMPPIPPAPLPMPSKFGP